MHQVHVTIDINAPVGQVFDMISDHASFLTGGGATCRLIKEGAENRNGTGAIREVVAGSMRFEEAIVAFDAPKRYDYKIVKLTAGGKERPLEHDRGWVTFQSVGSATRVDWYTRYRVTVPLLGWFVERWVIAPTMRPKFLAYLERAKGKLEGSSQS
jgi:hypothetical protein